MKINITGCQKEKEEAKLTEEKPKQQRKILKV